MHPCLIEWQEAHEAQQSCAKLLIYKLIRCVAEQAPEARQSCPTIFMGINPFMPTVAFNICCLKDCVSRTANVERNGGHKWVKREYQLRPQQANEPQGALLQQSCPTKLIYTKSVLKKLYICIFFQKCSNFHERCGMC